jgi:hypothetical protein
VVGNLYKYIYILNRYIYVLIRKDLKLHDEVSCNSIYIYINIYEDVGE